MNTFRGRVHASCLGLLLAGGCSPSALGTQQSGNGAPQLIWPFAIGSAVLAAIVLLQWRRSTGLAACKDRLATMHAILEKAELCIRRFTESQEVFVGNLAREIKAPLTTLLIQADLLAANGNDPATVHRYSKSIAEDLRHLSDLVESFLRLARPFAQEDTSNHVPVHFHDLVLEAVRRCRSLAAARAVHVVPILAETATGMGAVEVLGDVVLLEAMIENLVRNSVLSAPQGTQVDLHVTTKGDDVWLAVSDHGASVDAKRFESACEGFFRVHAAPRPSASSGMSLAVAKRVAEHHRGTISLRNLPGGGSEFAVQLPRWQTVGPDESDTNGRAGDHPRAPTHAGSQ